MRDLREKLSWTGSPQLRVSHPPKFKREAAKPALKIAAGETKSETRTALNRATKKKSQKAIYFIFFSNYSL